MTLKLTVRMLGRFRRGVWWIPITGVVFALVASVGQASAIARASTSTVVNTTATNVVSVATPSQTQSGDVLVACLALNGGNVASSGVPSGWQPLASVTAISNPHVFGYYKVASSSEPASYSWNLASSVANGAGIARYSGVDTTSPLDTAVATASGASATSGTVGGVTTVTANTMLVGCMGINSSATSVTISAPTGMSQAWNIGGKRHQFADGSQAAAGASGSKKWTFSASREWAGWLAALRPATTSTVSPPSNTALPTISGTPVVGSTLTATTGTWTSTTTITGYTYQWQNSLDGTTWANTTGTGATTNSYTVASADAGRYLHVVVTATNSDGSASATSASTAMVPPYNSVLPATCTTPTVGVACGATNGTWAGAATYTYQWQTSPDTTTWTNATGTGATTNSYTPANTDAGLYLNVVVTATNTGGSASATSNATVVAAQSTATPPSNTALPTISGTPVVGSTLTATTGTWTSTTTITGYTYQWQNSLDGTTWANTTGTGATTNSYTVASADAGRYLHVVVTATNSDGSASATSASTAMVPPYNSVLPATCTTPTVGVACGATNGTWAGAATYTYQWQTSPDTTTWTNATGTGATTNSYTPANTDAGLYLNVVVTATNTGGSASATSNATVVAAQSTATPPSNTALPTISGTAQAGQTLSASTGTWSGTPTITYTYQWQRCDSAGATCGPISTATGTTYTLATADVGSTIRVVVTATNTAGSSSATSDATAVVQAATVTPFVALWHMDETSGTVMYDSAGSHNGMLHSILLGLPGFSGTAYGLNGTSSYVSVPSSSDLNPGSANLTVTIHLKTTTAPSSPDWDLIRKGVYTSSGGEFKMEYQPGGQASCGFNGSSSYAELQAGPALDDGNWHTVQCVKTASAIQVVVDGVIYSKAATIGTIANTDPVVVGSHAGTAEFFNGSLDEASYQIW